MSGKRSITPETESEIVAAYGRGERSGEIAKRFGINRKTVITVVKRNGAEVLAQQLASGRRPMDTTPLHPEIVRLCELGWSQQAIADEVGISQAVVSRVIRSQGLDRRAPRAGIRASNWRGGRTVNGDGYVLVMVHPDDPLAPMRNRMGYVLEHRLVMARSLGRSLSRNETVHHINGDRLDNRIGNLQLRQGRHGKGAAFACLDCGSHNVGPVPLREVPLYQCAGCGLAVAVVDGAVFRACSCDAAVLANATATAHGAGGVKG